MKTYIDKSAVVAEIEKRRSKNARNKLNLAAAFEDNYLLSFIGTLEVKEVDLEKEWKEYFKYRGDVATVNLKHLAKHFFELGLKAQTDAFNDKAVEYIANNMRCDGYTLQTKATFIKGFKDYMKGE